MTASPARVVVLGGGYAGVLAAIRLARRAAGRAEVTLVNARPDFVERIRAHQRAAGQAARHIPLAPLVGRAGVRLHVGQASALDPAHRTVTVDGAPLVYDRLVYALGSQSVAPPAAYHVEDPAFALAVRAARRLVIVGGGLTAIESAAELAEASPELAITLVTAGPIGPALSDGARAHVRTVLTTLGVTLVEDTAVLAAEPGRVVTRGATFEADAILWATGFRAPPLAREAGLACDADGRVLVDAALHALSDPAIVVAGDAAATPLERACKTAMPQGAHAADVVAAELAGRDAAPFRFGDSGVCVSLGRHDAAIDVRRADGTRTGRVFTRRTGAFIKEAICRYTVLSLGLQARNLWDYRWIRPARPLLAGAAPKELAA